MGETSTTRVLPEGGLGACVPGGGVPEMSGNPDESPGVLLAPPCVGHVGNTGGGKTYPSTLPTL